ncbi:MAG TPA: RodZ domain-containing protein [Rhodocyclaceae bacterium]|jgi:cytoskeleton protein RodZ|nr:RodZ domain-containing protein [Rhodocyclaceae bacterium]
MSEMNESLFPDAPVEVPPLPLPGTALREAREAHGYSLADVSLALKFGVRQLEALENDDYSNLKGTTFVRGFVRSYARYLKLDEVPLLKALEPRLPAPVAEVKVVESMDAEMPTQGADIHSRRAYAIAIAVLLLGALAWFAVQGHAPSPKPVDDQVATPTPSTLDATAPRSESAQANAIPAITASPETQPATTTTPVAPATATLGTQTAVPADAPTTPATPAINPDERQLVLSFSAESWVEVRDGTQHVIFSGRSPAGSNQTLHGKPPFQLVVGNAPAVKLHYEDRDIDLQPYTRVDVARLTLDDNTK